MEGMGLSEAQEAAERIRRAVELEEFHNEGVTLRCTISVGVATLREDGCDKDRFLTCAEQALYQAKRSGRNQSRVFRKSFGAGPIP
jgi:diguanylate cyclase (GGDEF)-like protein